MSIAVITGATSGIGLATAKILAENKFDVIITGRRSDRLHHIADEIAKKSNVKVMPLVFDVRNRAQVFQAFESLPEEWQQIEVLVNNAGLALGFETFDMANIDDWETMIDTNIKGLLYVTKSVLPYMKNLGRGHIVNLSSIAGNEVYPNGNLYCVTKHAVEAASKAMRIDLLKYHIKVTNIAPGMAETEFSIVRYHGDRQRAKSVYEGFTPLSANDIAEAILFAVTRPAHVCIQNLMIMPTEQATATIVDRKSSPE
jgi:NADP-dependent 3-hydroxy acid dehydrogenase YdfG